MSVTKKEEEVPLAPQWAICLPEDMNRETKFGPMAILNVWYGSKAFLVSGSSTVLVRQNYRSVGTRKKEEGSVTADAHYMDSNSSMRCLVLPCRIWRRVLYLSRPSRMFSAWIMSLVVFLDSSRALASSEVRACEEAR